MLPSRPIFTGVFTCEGEKVLEMIRDAVRGMSPRVSPLGEEPDG